jgi:HlyD family secretion protein
MKSKFKAFYNYAMGHKKFSAVVLVVIVLAIYGIFRTSSSSTTATQYVFSKVQKQNVSVSVTGSGQVSALDQVDVSSQVSGTVDYVEVKAGDSVTKGKVIAHLDSTDASRAIDNADLNLTNAQISYTKAQKKSQDQAASSSISDLNQAYENGYKAIANTFVDLPDIELGINSILYDPSHSPYFTDNQIRYYAGDTAIGYKSQAGTTFDKFKTDYDSVFSVYKSISPNTHSDDIVTALNKTYDLTKELSVALTGTYNSIDYVNERISSNKPAQISTDKNQLSSYISKVNSDLTNIQSSITDIENAKDSATTAELDQKSAELALNQAEDSLKTAKETLANHTIVAPFDGVIAKVPVEVGDKISNGANVATIITKSMKVVISLNEVDAAKIAVGNKATLVFDAIDGLTMEGTVYEIDVLGTVNNGVVSYGVNISFDSTDDRIKAGMTTSVSISTGSASDTLAVSSAAISSSNGKSYVLVPISNTTGNSTTDKSTLKEIEVQTGLSGDTLTEIKSGLSEGATYVSGTKVIAASKNTSGSLFSMFGGSNSRNTTTRSGTSSNSRSTTSSSSSSSSSKTSSSGSQSQGGFNGSNMPVPPQ